MSEGAILADGSLKEAGPHILHQEPLLFYLVAELMEVFHRGDVKEIAQIIIAQSDPVLSASRLALQYVVGRRTLHE